MSNRTTVNYTTEQLKTALEERLHGGLPAHLGVTLQRADPSALTLRLQIQPQHMAANGYLHAGTIITLADTACGFGCLANLPAGAHSFTTIELKSNFLRTATAGEISAVATLLHGGRRTQVWDATVSDGHDNVMALFRCTQMILYP
ncbi:MAG TPA: PaaI family thioesterase [Caldilineaceae bacterium]|nr:PaaI family thioesterase [Caldilineaceae bacterium]